MQLPDLEGNTLEKDGKKRPPFRLDVGGVWMLLHCKQAVADGALTVPPGGGVSLVGSS